MADSFTLAIPHEQLAAKAKEAGLSPKPDGTLPEIDGVTLGYSIVNLTKEGIASIQFKVIKKPFYVSVGMIENHVKALLGV